MMDKLLKSRWFFLYPVFLFAILFFADNVANLESLKMLSQSDPTYIYYDYKRELPLQMAVVQNDIREWNSKVDASVFIDHAELGDGKRVPIKKGNTYRRHIIAIFGSSRLLYFDPAQFRRDYPDWELFNMSAPVTMPAFHLYSLESVLAAGARPDFILVEVDPFQCNDVSGAFQKSNLRYGFDPIFAMKNHDLFTHDDISSILGRSLFASWRYPLDLNYISQRFGKKDHKMIQVIQVLDQYQKENRGAGRSIFLRENYYQEDSAVVEISAAASAGWLYGNYTYSPRQMKFLERLLTVAQKNHIQVMLIRPPVSRPMVQTIAENKRYDTGEKLWQKDFDILRERFNVPFLDMTRLDGSATCNTFVDGAHMSLDCYPRMLDEALQFYKNR